MVLGRDEHIIGCNMLSEREKAAAKRFVLFTVFLYALGFGIIIPVLPTFIMILEDVNLADATFIGGLIAASYALFQFLLGPLIGNLSDRYGRRPVFLLSLAGFAIDYLLMGFAPSIIWLFIGRSIAGGLGAIFGPANSAMADMLDEDERAKGFGLVGAAFGIGFIMGPAIGGVLAEYSPRLPFFLAAALAALVFVYGLIAFPETLPKSKRRSFEIARANPVGALLSLGKTPAITRIALVYLLWMTASAIYPASWTYFARAQYGWGDVYVGYSLAIVGLSMTTFQTFVLGRFVSRYGERRTAFIAIVCAMVGFTIYMVNPYGWVTLLVCCVIGVQGMAMPSLNAMMSRRVPENMQGELQGFNGSLAALSAFIAPLLYNSVLTYTIDPARSQPFAGAPFAFAFVIAALSLVILAGVERRQAGASRQTA